MSSFDVTVRRIESITEHPNADNIECAHIDGYIAVVPKGEFHEGDLAVYIPEQSLLPEWLLADMGLVGKLAGPQKNRVKAIKLRGVLSQGLLYRPPNLSALDLNELYELQGDMAGVLGIEKWKPEIPAHMSGDVEFNPYIVTYTDIESLQKHPHMFRFLPEDEAFAYTEKLHGSCLIVGRLDGQRVVSSKGIAGKHLVLKESDENVYWRAAKAYRIHDLIDEWFLAGSDVLIFGEVLGVQDLSYGFSKSDVGFRAFDLWINGGYFPFYISRAIFELMPLPSVPVLHEGPFDMPTVRALASGPSTIADHIREGVVVRPLFEHTNPRGERMIAKYVSPEYLTRKGDTTEYE